MDKTPGLDKLLEGARRRGQQAGGSRRVEALDDLNAAVGAVTSAMKDVRVALEDDSPTEERQCLDIARTATHAAKAYSELARVAKAAADRARRAAR